MLNHSTRTYKILFVGAASSIILVEALTDSFKKEEYYCSWNKQPDIPAEHFGYSHLQHTGILAATTSGSGYIVSL